MLELIWAPYPHRAGFCITDDTDGATNKSVEIVYDFLADIGLRATKTVWAFKPNEPCGIPALPDSIRRGITLEDSDYLSYCQSLHDRGFEVCLHGASSGNNKRERTVRAIRMVENLFGHSHTYVCHAKNAENPYWHEKVALEGPARWFLSYLSRYRCSGEDPTSPYFWGDVCQQSVRQIRLFRTQRINTLAANPTMPYHDPEKPLVPSWFSATKRSFRDCTTPDALAQLKAENGLCVLYQYLQRYADLDKGRPQEGFRASAERLMATSGIWVDTVAKIMDRLRQVQAIFVARRGSTAWIVNAGPSGIDDLQFVSRNGQSIMPGADASWHGEILRVPHVGAGQMIELASAAPLRFDGCRTVHLDDQRRAKVAIDFGDLFINASDEPWQPSASLTVAPRSSHVKFEDSVAAFGPMRRATAGELHRLLLGQLKIIAWEIMFKGRNLDSKKFLGAETITLENQETW